MPREQSPGRAGKTRQPKPQAAAAPARAVTPPAWAVAALLVLLALVVQRQTLHRFFALDDLILFQQAAGIRPWPLTAWRWLSGWAWFHAVVPLWGHEPFPYHATSLLVHVANTLLLHRLARRWGASPVAALVGAGLFTASRLHFPALFAATSIGELLALTGTLGALLLADARGRALAAVAVFALAVSAKESVMLVPLAALLVRSPGQDVRSRARALAPLLATGVVLGALLLAGGVGSGRLGGGAYAVSFGANLLENVARLFGWSVDLLDPIPDLHAATTGAAKFVLPLVAAALTALAFRARAPLARAGAAWWWLAVLPVLPLPGRTYLHYLYVPLAGLALVAAALWDRALAMQARDRRGAAAPGRAAWGVALAVLVAYGAWNDLLISMRLDLRMESTDWPLDPVIRKSEIAQRSIGDVRAALAGRHARVVILIPASISRAVDLGTGRVDADMPVRRYALEEVLDQGRSMRAQVPQADSVVFVHDYEPGRDGWRCFLSLSDSHLASLGEIPAAHARFVGGMLASGHAREALDYADKALADRPGDATLRALRERAAAAAGAAR